MINVYVHQNGSTKLAERVEPEWLGPSSDVTLWVDLTAPGEDDRRLLLEVSQAGKTCNHLLAYKNVAKR